MSTRYLDSILTLVSSLLEIRKSEDGDPNKHCMLKHVIADFACKGDRVLIWHHIPPRLLPVWLLSLVGTLGLKATCWHAVEGCGDSALFFFFI